jgi:hypothetical protein
MDAVFRPEVSIAVLKIRSLGVGRAIQCHAEERTTNRMAWAAEPTTELSGEASFN